MHMCHIGTSCVGECCLHNALHSYYDLFMAARSALFTTYYSKYVGMYLDLHDEKYISETQLDAAGAKQSESPCLYLSIHYVICSVLY